MSPDLIADENDESMAQENVSVESIDVTCAGSDQYPWSHSKIRFNLDDTKVVEVGARGMLTSADCRNIWYQPSDFSRMSSHNRSTVKMMREFGSIDDELDHCIRGLEHKVHGESEHVKDIRLNAVYAVLKEQSRQRKLNNKDEQRVAEIYREHVFSSMRKAQERGFDDEATVRQDQGRGQNRQRSHLMTAFDDFDLKELRELGLHDDMDRFEWRMSELKPPTELYEVQNGEKAGRKPSRSKRISNWVSNRSISPKRDSNPQRSSGDTRSLSPKPDSSPQQQDGGSKPLRRVLSGGLSMILGGSNHDRSPRKSSKGGTSNQDRISKSSREKSPKPTSSKSSKDRRKELPLPGRRVKDHLEDLPLPGKRNPPLSNQKNGLRKIRSDMF